MPTGKQLTYQEQRDADARRKALTKHLRRELRRKRKGVSDGGGAKTALIAAVVSLLVAGLGGAFTYLASSTTSQSEDDRSRTEFVRTQRQAAYSKVVADDGQMNPGVTLLINAFTLFSEFTPQVVGTGQSIEFQRILVHNSWDPLKPKVDALVTDLANAEIDASDSTIESIHHLKELMATLTAYVAVVDGAEGVVDSGLGDHHNSALIITGFAKSDVSFLQSSWEVYAQEFIDAARDDQLS